MSTTRQYGSNRKRSLHSIIGSNPSKGLLSRALTVGSLPNDTPHSPASSSDAPLRHVHQTSDITTGAQVNNVHRRLLNRELYGPAHAYYGTKERVYRAVPKRNQRQLRQLFQYDPDAASCVFLGFSACGDYLLSYSTDFNDQYYLQYWRARLHGGNEVHNKPKMSTPPCPDISENIDMSLDVPPFMQKLLSLPKVSSLRYDNEEIGSGNTSRLDLPQRLVINRNAQSIKHGWNNDGSRPVGGLQGGPIRPTDTSCANKRIETHFELAHVAQLFPTLLSNGDLVPNSLEITLQQCPVSNTVIALGHDPADPSSCPLSNSSSYITIIPPLSSLTTTTRPESIHRTTLGGLHLRYQRPCRSLPSLQVHQPGSSALVRLLLPIGDEIASVGIIRNEKESISEGKLPLKQYFVGKLELHVDVMVMARYNWQLECAQSVPLFPSIATHPVLATMPHIICWMEGWDDYSVTINENAEEKSITSVHTLLGPLRTNPSSPPTQQFSPFDASSSRQLELLRNRIMRSISGLGYQAIRSIGPALLTNDDIATAELTADRLAMVRSDVAASSFSASDVALCLWGLEVPPLSLSSETCKTDKISTAPARFTVISLLHSVSCKRIPVAYKQQVRTSFVSHNSIKSPGTTLEKLTRQCLSELRQIFSLPVARTARPAISLSHSFQVEALKKKTHPMLVHPELPCALIL